MHDVYTWLIQISHRSRRDRSASVCDVHKAGPVANILKDAQAGAQLEDSIQPIMDRRFGQADSSVSQQLQVIVSLAM
jgi:hypothetical protein